MQTKYLPIVNAAMELGVTDENQIRYVLATVQHETNGTFQPIREAYWVRNKLIRRYGKAQGSIRFENWGRRHFKTTKSKVSYYPYYGRGYVQLTWKRNYAKFTDILIDQGYEGCDLVKYPDQALNHNIAAFILVYGMIHGTFTGRKLSDYINDYKVDYIGARRIINGRDKAMHIASLAERIVID